jgi:hypothetical protein
MKVNSQIHALAVLSPGKGHDTISCLLHSDQTDSRAHPVSLLMGSEALSPGVKWPLSAVWRRGKNICTSAVTSPHFLMAWYFIKYVGNFIIFYAT